MTATPPPAPDDGAGTARWALLASAIAGRPVEVAPVAPGQPAWTDGVTVYIDPDDPPGRRLAAIAVQASLLGAGSLEPPVVGALIRRPSSSRRYLSLEGHRALAAHEPLLPLPVRGLIDRALAGRSTSPAASLAIATGREELPDPPDAFGTLRPKQLRPLPQRGAAGGQPLPHVPRDSQKARLRELDPDEEEGPVVDLTSPVGGGGGLGALLKRLFGEGRSAGGGPPGADAPTHRARAPGVGAAAARSSAPAPVTTEPAIPAGQAFTYPEWDAHRRRYRPEWCTVSEVDPAPGERGALRLPDTHALRRPLARLGLEFDRRHRQLQGDEIDIDAVVDARAAMVAGSAADEGVYIDTVRGRRDLSVLVLLDVSGSAAEPSPTGAPVHEHQRAVAAALTLTLHELGDRVALYGFRSQGRRAVHVIPVKRFGEPFDRRAVERLGGFVPAAYTRLGAAIRHGTEILCRESGTSRRLLVVLSDGFAYDHGYERAYGEADARRALSEARRRGIGAMCCSVGAGTDAEALRRVFGTAAYGAIPRADALPAVVGPLFRSALRSAEQQRRRYQRRERAWERLDLERRAR